MTFLTKRAMTQICTRTTMSEHSHSWHEFYANSYTKMRECYGCGAIEVNLENAWIPEKVGVNYE